LWVRTFRTVDELRATDIERRPRSGRKSLHPRPPRWRRDYHVPRVQQSGGGSYSRIDPSPESVISRPTRRPYRTCAARAAGPKAGQCAAMPLAVSGRPGRV
jgi:hypothetical protein